MPSAFRNLAFLALLIFLFSCSSPKGYIPYEGLNGKPHHVQLIDFEAITDGSLTEPQVSSWEIYEFDEKGRNVGYQVMLLPRAAPAVMNG
ncbi:hypothetical protein [Algoriphagus boritolerans]|uniref:Uncharacterized protein n=1 Tax=Algoriphagus boritolerans DSM 17298 = JCM 18970 TaxID=1120964 RepID=A0A1H5ZF53_9BACT|nr:hypothetical protein [Algoriphagus boritolerans]SEG35109.1 hypothetical protein SAMN03080598_03481 [Algoriphagus boritolerans DSM 17298 = JCM 18970]